MADTKATIDNLEKRIEAQIGRHNSAKRATVTIYAILIVVILGFYMVQVIPNVKKATEPKFIADIAVSAAEDNIPKVRAQVSQQLQTKAPEYVSEFIDHGLAEVPRLREDFEAELMRKVKAELALTEVELGHFVDYAYEKHGDQIRPIIKELDAAKTSEEIEAVLFELLKQPFDHQDLRVELETYGIALQGLAEHLHYLRTEGNLDEIQRLEREVIVVLKEISDRSG